jgi:hypothetical protein
MRDARCQRLIVGHYGAGIPVSAEVLAGVKAEGRRNAERADALTLPRCIVA